MARGTQGGIILGGLRTLFDDGAVGGLTDGDLLGRFLGDPEESGRAAFGALVERHGPLVLGVCRRALGDPHQAEDAFQATFLVLASKARSIRDREAVASWLVGVAGRIAARARDDAHRRRRTEARLAEAPSSRVEPEAADAEVVAALLEEVERLRRPLREAVVLCHLRGLSYASAAQELGVTEGAIRGRLARARDRLRARLSRRGIAAEASASALVAPRLSESLPARLVEATAQAARRVASGQAVAGIVPGAAIIAMEGALHAMRLANLKTAALVALGVGVITLGAAVGAQARPKGKAQAAVEPAKPAPPQDEAANLAKLVEGRVVRSVEVSKDAVVLAYMPDLALGTVDNLGIGNNDGGVRTLVDWPDVPAVEAKLVDRKFYLAFYSRKTMANPKPGSILGFELTSGWPEWTTWRTLPSYDPDPVLTAKFEPGDGWKVFDVTSFVRDREGKSGEGLILRFLGEDNSSPRQTFSDYKLVSREGKDEWAKRRPLLVVVEPVK